MDRVNIDDRYIEDEEVRINELPYLEYYQCVNETFNLDKVMSFCDVGCATGHVIHHLKKNHSNISVKGYEYFEYHKTSKYCHEEIRDNIEIYDIDLYLI